MAEKYASATTEHCLLGVDIGTSTVKVVLAEEGSHRVLQECSRALGPDRTMSSVPRTHERDVPEIFSALDWCVAALEPELLQRVCAIGVTGQMHGCVLWKSGASLLSDGRLQSLPHPGCSSLITWQDKRCSPEFLSSLPQTHQPVPVSAGYGCATLFWLQAFRPEEVALCDRAGTVMDLVVWALCGSEGEVVMSAQNATSWGYFDVKTGSWETQLQQSSGFPSHLLPRVAQAPCLAGLLKSAWGGLPVGTKVGVGMGDLQCAIYAASPMPTDAVLNIGSASQLATIKPCCSTEDGGSDTPYPASVMAVPYFRGDSLIVAAALGGGNVIATFVSTLQDWLKALGVSQDVCLEANIYQTLLSEAEGKTGTPLEIEPVLWGERHAPSLRGSVSNVSPNNLTLGDIGSASLRGIVHNLLQMMPKNILEGLNVKRVLGSGSLLQKSAALRWHVEREFGLPLVLREAVDAPLGAAMAVEAIRSE